MTVREYIIEKNRILKEKTGLTLVPEPQIIDFDFNEELSCNSDAECCPYCMEFLICDRCPMSVAGNECGVSHNNTYDSVREEVEIYKVPEIVELVERWNAEREV